MTWERFVPKHGGMSGFWTIAERHGSPEVARRIRVSLRYVNQMRSLERDVTPDVMAAMSLAFPDEWDANAHIAERALRRGPTEPSVPAASHLTEVA